MGWGLGWGMSAKLQVGKGVALTFSLGVFCGNHSRSFQVDTHTHTPKQKEQHSLSQKQNSKSTCSLLASVCDRGCNSHGGGRG